MTVLLPRFPRLTVNSALAILVVLALASLGHVAAAPSAAAQSGVVINEVVSSNTEIVAPVFGLTSDWIELQNNGSAVNLADWTIADDGAVWTFPATVLGPGERVIVWASGLNVTSFGLHSNFKVSATSGETLTLVNPAGTVVDSLAVPPLPANTSYGRGSNGQVGYLASTSFLAPNGPVTAGAVQLLTAPQAFSGSLQVNVAGGGTIRYTTNDQPVTPQSPLLNGPITVTSTTVVRAARVTNGAVGPEVSGTYIEVSGQLASRSSDVPIVLIHAEAPIGQTNGPSALRPAFAAVIDRTVAGTATPLAAADYVGHAGLRIRGESSSGPDFLKKQYRFDLWAGSDQSTAQADLLGLGEDGDWTLYAPGHYDRAIVNNPFMYELGKQVGVASPGWQFVELYVSTNQNASITTSDYAGLYLLRETIKIDKNRLDLSETDGFVVAYDWDDDCCVSIENHPTWYPSRSDSRIVIAEPNASKLTGAHEATIRGVWNQLQAASAAGDFNTLDSMIDWDSFLSHWILEVLAKDVDLLVASHFVHQDSDGLLRGGPMWDYDRSMGSADDLNNQLSEAVGWDYASQGQTGGHSYDSDIYAGLWQIPEVQALLRARWAALRSGPLSNAAMENLIFDLGAQIDGTPYERERSIYGFTVSGYGPRPMCSASGALSNGGCATRHDLGGELLHLTRWVQTRADWLDQQWSTNSAPPVVINPGTITIAEQTAIDLQLQAVSPLPIVFDFVGLPDGLIGAVDGSLTGAVAYGESGVYPLVVTVTSSLGAATTVNLDLNVSSALAGQPAVVLNEYNAVAPGRLLDAQGADATLGSVAGNGGDWFEFVIVDDGLDLRGWSFDLWSNNGAGVMTQNASLKLRNDLRLSQMRAGSIVTVAESQPEDLSYDPRRGDFTMNLRANSAGAGALFASQSDFDTNNAKWRVVIRDSSGTVRAEVAGETTLWDNANLGVSDREVFALQTTPSRDVDPVSDYRDVTQSSFGQPNPLPGGGVQSFAALRPIMKPDGDINCDGKFNIADAYSAARFSVGLDPDVGVCATTTADGVDAWAGDLSRDGVTNIADASLIASCVVGLDFPTCP